MKKIFYILVSAIVALGAVACNNEIDENIEANNSGGVSFTVALDDEASRIVIEDRDDLTGKHAITFEAGDVIYAENSTLGIYEFVCQSDEVTFTCRNKSSKDMLPDEMVGATMNFYNSKLPYSYKGADGIVLKATQKFADNDKVTLTLGNPVFMFSSAYKVILNSTLPIFSLESGIYAEEYVVEQADGVHYIPVADAGEITFSYTIDGETEPVKSLTKDFDNKIYDLGALSTAVATVDGQVYTSLEKAIEKAIEKNLPIVLVNDLDLTEAPLVISKDMTLTIDLNGKTISATNACTASYSMITNNGTLTLVDNAATKGKVSFTDNGAGDSSASWGSYTLSNTGTLVIDGVTVENLSAQNVDGAAFKHCFMAIQIAGGTTTIKNESVISAPHYRSVRVNRGALIIEGGVFDGQIWMQPFAEGTSIAISGGEFGPNWNDGSSLFVGNETHDVATTITGGHFTTKIGTSDTTKDGIKNAVTGGTFVVDPSAIVHYEQKAVLNDTTGFYEIVYKVPVAYIEGSEELYESLEEVFEVAEADQTIKVLEGKTFNSFPASSLKEGVTVEFHVDANGERTNVINGSNNLNANGATVKNARFEHNGTTISGTVNGNFENCLFFGGWSAMHYAYVNANTTATFTGCKFHAAGAYAVNFDGNSGSLVFDDCEFIGWSSFAGSISQLTIKNSVFNSGNATYNYFRPYCNTTLENVNFVYDGTSTYEAMNPRGTDKTFIFDDVTINDVPVTYEGVSADLGVKVTIDDVLYTYVADGVVLVGDNDYEISNKAGMFWLANEVNSGNNNFKGKTVKLVYDIDLENAAWTPIGVQNYTNNFAGTFDGNGKVISNLTCDHENTAALFGTTCSAYIKNVIVDGATITSRHYAAGILAWGESGGTCFTVENCQVKNATITSSVDSAVNDNGDKVGGIVGFSYVGTVTGCSVENVTIQGYRDLGGVVGYATRGEVSNNTLANVTIIVDNSINYKNYVIQEHYNVNNYVGRIGEEPTLSGNSGEATINWGGVPEYVAQINGVNYATVDAAVAAVKDGETIIVAEGEFSLPNLAANSIRTVTVKGAGMNKTTLNGPASAMNYANYTHLILEDLTYVTCNNGYNGGFGHAASVEMNRVKVVGQYYCQSGAPHTLTDCVIDPLTGYFYTYSSDVTFENCDFTASNGKAVQVYTDSSDSSKTYNVTFNNCDFINNGSVAQTWDGKDVTGIDINSNGGYFVVNINNCTTTGFGIGLKTSTDLFNLKSNVDKISVYVDGKLFIAPYVYYNDNAYELYNKEGMFWFNNQVNVEGNTFKGETVKVISDIDLENEVWLPIGQQSTTQFEGTFDGGNYTLSNVNLKDLTQTAGYAVGLFGWIHSAPAQIKNINMDGVVVEGIHYVAPIVGYLSGGADVYNCSVNNAAITAYCYLPDTAGEFNGDKVGGIVGFTNDGSTIDGCVVANTTINAYRHIGGIVGYTYGIITNNTIGANVVINLDDNGNDYKAYDTAAEYGLNSVVGVAGSGSTVENNSGEATINYPAKFTKKVFILNDMQWAEVGVHAFIYVDGNNDVPVTEWPNLVTETQTIEGNEYLVYTLPAKLSGSKVSYVFNNNGKGEEIKKLNVTMDSDKYFRLAPMGAIEIDPADNTTFKYAIYAFNQKNTSVAPYYYVWGSTAFDTAGWRGNEMPNATDGSYTKNGNVVNYFYVEVPVTEFDANGMNFIVNSTKGQTSDLLLPSTPTDVYVGYWWDSADSNGCWANSDITTIMN